MSVVVFTVLKWGNRQKKEWARQKQEHQEQAKTERERHAEMVRFFARLAPVTGANIIQRMDEVEADVLDLRESNQKQTDILEHQNKTLEDQNEIIDHLIVHLARNDLHAANLLKEAEARLKAKGKLVD